LHNTEFEAQAADLWHGQFNSSVSTSWRFTLFRLSDRFCMYGSSQWIWTCIRYKSSTFFQSSRSHSASVPAYVHHRLSPCSNHCSSLVVL